MHEERLPSKKRNAIVPKRPNATVQHNATVPKQSNATVQHNATVPKQHFVSHLAWPPALSVAYFTQTNDVPPSLLHASSQHQAHLKACNTQTHLFPPNLLHSYWLGWCCRGMAWEDKAGPSNLENGNDKVHKKCRGQQSALILGMDEGAQGMTRCVSGYREREQPNAWPQTITVGHATKEVDESTHEAVSAVHVLLMASSYRIGQFYLCTHTPSPTVIPGKMWKHTAYVYKTSQPFQQHISSAVQACDLNMDGWNQDILGPWNGWLNQPHLGS
eukprot:717528-Pelagomonas_calceolata.AAC.2